MLFYSRNILISLRKWHKTLKLSVRMSGLANIESMAEAGILLYFYFLGSGSHLKDHRPMLNRRKTRPVTRGGARGAFAPPVRPQRSAF